MVVDTCGSPRRESRHGLDTNQTEDSLAPSRLGRLEGEAFDAALHEEERREREDRLSRLTCVAADAGTSSAEATASAAEVWRLERDVERLAAYHLAVNRSRAWRVVQWLRRPLGRAW